MKWFLPFAFVLGGLSVTSSARGESPRPSDRTVLVIHGGSGVKPKGTMSREQEAQARRVLERALQAGFDVIRRGGRSLDAVEAAIKVMEDSSIFNAGRGAVFTHEGRNELDASIMEGKSKKAGAVAGVTRIKNPIAAARAVMERSPHVLMIGEGADRFAVSQRLEEVNPVYFWTPERWKELQEALKNERDGVTTHVREPGTHFGTVGAVALDSRGDLAAGTSTGGMTNKRFGRVGDSPIIGAGTFADNLTCAVSATGHGEVFIRHTVAADVAARMKYRKQSVSEAAREVIASLPKEPGGVGGVIALDASGNAGLAFDTEAMYRGAITENGKMEVRIYESEPKDTSSR